MDLKDLTFAAEQLLHAYTLTLDDGRYEEWPDFFTEDALYKVIARENFDRGLPLATMFCDGKGMMRDRVVAIREASIYAPAYLRHLVSSVRIAGQENESYRVESNYAVLSTRHNEETKVFNAGKYLDRIVFVNGAAKFKEKVVVYDTLQIPSLLVIPI
ncbi:MAG TPA: aromatic-ring-hydroxylating dioxygenase subunit beta [Candidatus Acidoferrales bacterium]|nr:aromatic-ring-hydroxylating dioxygenase subunit beta [Candidatus Acidoferrales bacterium]